MSFLDHLEKILRPPAEPLEGPNGGSWPSAEKRLGQPLPDDYKGFIGRYGTGAIDGFLWVLNPFSSNTHLNFFDEGTKKLEALRQLRYESVPYVPFPDANGILPWGVSDNGDVAYWRCSGSPTDWTIVLNESRGPHWAEFQLSTCEFLAKIVSRELVVDFFPRDFPSLSPRFVQLD